MAPHPGLLMSRLRIRKPLPFIFTCLQVKVLDTVEVFIGWEWEARILERFCEYVIDGVPGWGVSEWHYRHYGGRPQEFTSFDPPEIKEVPKY